MALSAKIVDVVKILDKQVHDVEAGHRILSCRSGFEWHIQRGHIEGLKWASDLLHAEFAKEIAR